MDLIEKAPVNSTIVIFGDHGSWWSGEHEGSYINE